MFGSKPLYPAREKAGAQGIPAGTVNQFPTPAAQSRAGLVPTEPAPDVPKGMTPYELRVLELLKTIAGALVTPRPIFNPARITLAAGTVSSYANGVIPDEWYISVENTVGALLEIHTGEFAGFPWLVLGPGESARFPALLAKVVVKNSGAITFGFTVAAISANANIGIRVF